VALQLAPTKVSVAGGSIEITEQVPFEFGQAALGTGSDAILAAVANAILSSPSIITVEVSGHTDNVGGVAYNQALSEQRAQAVRAALIARGVPAEKLVARGYGTQRPLGSNDDESGRARNRRVEFEIAEQAE